MANVLGCLRIPFSLARMSCDLLRPKVMHSCPKQVRILGMFGGETLGRTQDDLRTASKCCPHLKGQREVAVESCDGPQQGESVLILTALVFSDKILAFQMFIASFSKKFQKSINSLCWLDSA